MRFWRQGIRPGPDERRQMIKAALTLLRQWDRLMEQDGMLYHWVYCPKGKVEMLQLVLPEVRGVKPIASATRTSVSAESAPTS